MNTYHKKMLLPRSTIFSLRTFFAYFFKVNVQELCQFLLTTLWYYEQSDGTPEERKSNDRHFFPLGLCKNGGHLYSSHSGNARSSREWYTTTFCLPPPFPSTSSPWLPAFHKERHAHSDLIQFPINSQSIDSNLVYTEQPLRRWDMNAHEAQYYRDNVAFQVIIKIVLWLKIQFRILQKHRVKKFK